MKLLIFTIGGIGDNIFATPFIRQLKYNIDCEIDVLTYKNKGAVFRNNPNINDILFLPDKLLADWKSTKIIKKILQVFKLKMEYRDKYDVVINFNKALITNWVARLLGGKRTIGFARKGEGKFLDYSVQYNGKIPEVWSYLNLLSYFNIKPDYDDIDFDLILTESEIEFANNFFNKEKLSGKKVIGICPGGQDSLENYTDLRRLPINKYEDLIQMLIKKNWKIILFGGKNNKDLENKLLRKFKNGVFSLIGKTTIGQTGAVMKKCEFVISHDSGCLHIATAVNKEGIIGIFGPTDPKRTAHPNITIFKNDCNCEPVVDVYARIDSEKQEHRCLEGLDITKIVRYIKENE